MKVVSIVESFLEEKLELEQLRIFFLNHSLSEEDRNDIYSLLSRDYRYKRNIIDLELYKTLSEQLENDFVFETIINGIAIYSTFNLEESERIKIKSFLLQENFEISAKRKNILLEASKVIG